MKFMSGKKESSNFLSKISKKFFAKYIRRNTKILVQSYLKIKPCFNRDETLLQAEGIPTVQLSVSNQYFKSSFYSIQTFTVLTTLQLTLHNFMLLKMNRSFFFFFLNGMFCRQPHRKTFGFNKKPLCSKAKKKRRKRKSRN